MMRLAIFDMDGTVFESYLDWRKIRAELGMDSGNILKELFLNKNKENLEKIKIVEKFERKNTLKTLPIQGVKEFLSYLANNSIRTALITNNNRKNTAYLLRKFNLSFDIVITRESLLWKPDPEPLAFAMRLFNLTPAETISIGDSVYDIKASCKANVRNIYILKRDQSDPEFENGVTYFDDYYQLADILKEKCRHVDIEA